MPKIIFNKAANLTDIKNNSNSIANISTKNLLKVKFNKNFTKSKKSDFVKI